MLYNRYMAKGRGRPSTSPRSDFGQRLFDLREKRGLTQAYVAEQLGISVRSYAFWERKTVAIHTEQLAQLAKMLGCSADYLIGASTEKNAKRNGPKGKLEQVFESLSELPKAKQKQIVGVVEAFVAQEAS